MQRGGRREDSGKRRKEWHCITGDVSVMRKGKIYLEIFYCTANRPANMDICSGCFFSNLILCYAQF